MFLRGIRGAITTEENTSESIIKSTTELLVKLFEENNIPVDSHAGMYNIVESLHRSNLSMWGESNRLWCIIQSVWFHGNQMGQKHATLGDLDYKAEYYY